MPTLENGDLAERPANQAFGGIEKMVHFLLRQLGHRARQIGEMKRLNGLYPESDFVDDAAQAVARFHHSQQVTTVGGGGLSKIATGGNPLDLCDVGIDLAEFDAIECVLGL